MIHGVTFLLSEVFTPIFVVMHPSKWILPPVSPSSVRLCPSNYTGDSDNSNSFWHNSDIINNRNIQFCEGILKIKVHGTLIILRELFFSVRIPWINLGGGGQDSHWQVHKWYREKGRLVSLLVSRVSSCHWHCISSHRLLLHNDLYRQVQKSKWNESYILSQQSIPKNHMKILSLF